MSKKVTVIISHHAKNRMLTRMALPEKILSDHAHNAWHQGSEERVLATRPTYKNYTTYKYREYKHHIFVFSLLEARDDGYMKVLLVTVFYNTKKSFRAHLNIHRKKL